MKHKSWGTRVLPLAFLGLLLFPALAPLAKAETIIKVPLADGGFDVTFNGTTLATAGDGDAATIGDQDTNVVFSGTLNFLPEINDRSASFTLAGVTVTGLPVASGPVLVQSTDNGTFSLWDKTNTLLIAGSLGTGAITGSTSATTGSFFNTTFANFTGGSLASLLDPNTAGLSLALASITSDGGFSGLRLRNDGTLAPFVADASGLVDARANSVPEPMSAMLLLAGLGSGAVFRRRRA